VAATIIPDNYDGKLLLKSLEQFAPERKLRSSEVGRLISDKLPLYHRVRPLINENDPQTGEPPELRCFFPAAGKKKIRTSINPESERPSIHIVGFAKKCRPNLNERYWWRLLWFGRHHIPALNTLLLVLVPPAAFAGTLWPC